ncbi:phenylalanine--tRNA ligase subunit beta [Caldalkalibacillus salinus]|uniref:phenylalanine--tRNA ligase subunit beta n=1 Tax=Caldalkalibacillus salinus TaxID=2803787 RepID=UPI0019231450|nr:phenylalanine--tRNA ligase subunit beta [Caldalkalibacillus salinus]
MLVSYKWLNQYVDLSGVSPQALAEKITRAGVEVDVIHERQQGIHGVVVGYVQDCQQHPNADKLRVCQVDIGEGEPSQIICGAPNVAQGQKVPVAKVGAVLPGDFKIKKAKLRGEASHGMICSAQELGIEDRLVAPEFKDGIMVLPEDLEVGSDALAHLDLDDVVLELDLTPNRSDCLSMIGVAYEVGAILGRKVHLPAYELQETGAPTADQVKIDIEAEDLCPHYAVRKVSNVKIGPSPLWLQNRLTAAGVRPINNVVDVTNYIMLEYGQPLHAFDAKQVKDQHIIVREAQQGEKVVTLDNQSRTLEAGTLLITDPEKTIAIAGVMGAANSEVEDDTTEIILESAYFDGPSVRHTSRALGLRSEASARFEKGVDPERIHAAVNHAAYLLSELAEGEVHQGVAEKQVRDMPRQDISVHLARLNKLLGTTLQPTEVTEIFDRLAFDYENKGHEIRVEVPTRRPDLAIEEDLMEEVARLYGYDEIPTTLPAGVTTAGSRTPRQQLRHTIKHYLQGAGLDQVVTYSLTSETNAQWDTFEKNVYTPIPLSMPMSEERSHLRTTLVPNLLEVTQYNKNRKQNHTHIFEVGHVFLTQERQLTSLPEQEERISGALSGLWQIHPWQQVKTPVDFFVVKGVLEGLFEKLDVGVPTFVSTQIDHYHPGRTALIYLKDEVVGFIGQLHPETQKELDLQPTYVFELSFERLLKHLPEEISFTSLPKFPGIQRDLAVVVNEDIKAGDLVQTIEEVGGELLRSVSLFDVYQGEGIEEGKKSMAYALYYLNPERTLTDEEVGQVHNEIVTALEKKWNALLRK